MDKMIDMKLSNKDKSNEVKTSSASPSKNPSNYPYGLSLSLEKDVLDKLGLDDCQVGDEFLIMAKGKVTSVSESSGENHTSKSVSLQLTKMSVKEAMPSMMDKKPSLSTEEGVAKIEGLLKGKKGN